MANFPTSADDNTTLPDPTATSKTNSPSHSSLHANENAAIKALEAKVGTGASTPTNNTLLRGNGTGTSIWSQLTSAQLAASLSDETGTGAAVFATSPTLVTPSVDMINEATPANGVTIDGVNLKDGVIASSALLNKVNTAAIQDDAVTAAKVDWASTGTNAGIWWEELSRNTLSVAGDTITITSIPARKYLKIFVYCAATGGTIGGSFRMNNDSTNNYSYRNSSNGGADGTAVSQSSAFAGPPASAAAMQVEAFINNVAAQEKIGFFAAVTGATVGAATAPSRIEGTFKWADTTNQITRLDYINGGTGDFAIGSEMIVLGHN